MDLSQLKNLVLKYLSYRPRSVAEVTKYLHSKSSNSDLINQTLDYLKKYKLVDDVAFTEWLVASRSRSRPRGSRLLKQELKSKGIDSTTISENIVEVDDRELAFQAIQTKLARWQTLSYQDFRIKAGRFLASRGFSWGVIEETVKKGYNDSHVNR